MSQKTDKRAKEILRLLLSHGKASVEELTAELKTSPASIRRDLIRLEQRGLVNRTHGDAMLAGNGGPVYEPFRFDASFEVREDRFADEKQRIARAAAALVQENETIGFAAGTTTTLVARQLLHRRNICVVTNAVNIGMELSSRTPDCRPRSPAATCVGRAPSPWSAPWPSSLWPGGDGSPSFLSATLSPSTALPSFSPMKQPSFAPSPGRRDRSSSSQTPAKSAP